MTLAVAHQPHGHTGHDLALAAVIGGASAAVMAAAHAILGDHAEHHGLTEQRTAALKHHNVMQTASLFTVANATNNFVHAKAHIAEDKVATGPDASVNGPGGLSA